MNQQLFLSNLCFFSKLIVKQSDFYKTYMLAYLNFKSLFIETFSSKKSWLERSSLLKLKIYKNKKLVRKRILKNDTNIKNCSIWNIFLWKSIKMKPISFKKKCTFQLFGDEKTAIKLKDHLDLFLRFSNVLST